MRECVSVRAFSMRFVCYVLCLDDLCAMCMRPFVLFVYVFLYFVVHACVCVHACGGHMLVVVTVLHW